MSAQGRPHGEPGHLNIYTRDQDSVITAHGAHYRVVAFLPDADGLYCRVDHKHGPRMPTPSEVLAVARKDQNIRGRWTLARTEAWADGTATEYYFVPASKQRGCPTCNGIDSKSCARCKGRTYMAEWIGQPIGAPLTQWERKMTTNSASRPHSWRVPPATRWNRVAILDAAAHSSDPARNARAWAAGWTPPGYALYAMRACSVRYSTLPVAAARESGHIPQQAAA